MSSTPLSLRMRLAQSKFRGRGTRRGRWRTFEINIVLVRDGKNVIPLVGLDGLDEVSFRVLKVDLYSANRIIDTGSNG